MHFQNITKSKYRLLRWLIQQYGVDLSYYQAKKLIEDDKIRLRACDRYRSKGVRSFHFTIPEYVNIKRMVILNWKNDTEYLRTNMRYDAETESYRPKSRGVANAI